MVQGTQSVRLTLRRCEPTMNPKRDQPSERRAALALYAG
jgi:hypothetical protein